MECNKNLSMKSTVETLQISKSNQSQASIKRSRIVLHSFRKETPARMKCSYHAVIFHFGITLECLFLYKIEPQTLCNSNIFSKKPLR